MNLFAHTGIEYFPVQHRALDILKLKLPKEPVQRLSATKLYVWLCSASTRGVVEATAQRIKNCTRLDEDTIASARAYLKKSNLIAADLEPGQGAQFSYTVLNLATGNAFRASEHSGADGYFTVPRLYLLPAIYKAHSGATVLTYLSALAQANRWNSAKLLKHSRAKLSSLSTLTQKTLSKALAPLTEGELPFLKVEQGSVEILNPETGTSMTSGKDIGSFHVVDGTTGKRVNITQILNPENFNRYFTSSVKDFNPGVVQQDVCCPFHSDTRPSLSINLDEGVWCCHACLTKGGLVDFEMKLLDTEDKRTAWKSVAQKLGVQLSPRARGEMTHEHFYTDVNGERLYAVRRYEDTSARFYKPTMNGKWKAGLNGVKRVPYRLPELVKADVVIITEGEKKADEVSALGLRDATGKPLAVTCTGSAGSWRVDYVDYLQNKRVLVFPDTDEPGQRYAQAISASFVRAGIEHRTVDFAPFGNDVRDFLREHTKEELVEYAKCEWLEQREEEVQV
jgi:hypothetical protein